VLAWTTTSWFRTKNLTKTGWLLPVKEGYLGPRDLFPTDQPTATLTIAGRTIELASAEKVERNKDVVLLKLEDSPPHVVAERAATQPEDGYLVVRNALDDETVVRLRRIAARLRRPLSHVVRESIKDYEARSDKLSEEERRRMLAVLDEIKKAPPTRSRAEVDAELREIRAARRRWGRRPPR